MSLKTIKSNLEQFLYANITTIPIKAYNTNIYTLNNAPVDFANIEQYIEARLIPITQDQELISTNDKYLTRAFFQITINVRVNKGTGESLDTESVLNGLFRNKKIGADNITCRNTSVLSPFQEGEWSVTTWRVVSELFNV